MGKFDQNKLRILQKIDKVYKSIYFRPKNLRIYQPIDKLNTKEIIIMGMMMIGDTIMVLPALRVIKKNFPNARITMVGGSAVQTVLKKQKLVDNFIEVKSPWLHKDFSLSNLLKFLLSLITINRAKYDLSIDFKGDWRNIFFMNFIRSARKASYNYTGGEYMLTDAIIPNPAINHYIEEWLFLLESVGCKIGDNDKMPVLLLDIEDQEYINKFKTANNLNLKFVIGVHPGASQEVKRWDEKKYGELIVLLSKQYENCVFVIYEGPNEKDTVTKLHDLLNESKVNYISVNKNLSEYILLLSICNLIICNDSGAGHIAGAFAISSVVIFGNIDPKYVTPYGAPYKKIISHMLECKPCHQSFCKFGTNECIAKISVSEVYNAVNDVLEAMRLDNYPLLNKNQ